MCASAPKSIVDDEYAMAGVKDPKIVITTSRDPSSRLTQFAKEIRLMFPGGQKINRGSYVLKDLVQACRSNDVTDLIMIHEHRGEPSTYYSRHLILVRLIFCRGACYFALSVRPDGLLHPAQRSLAARHSERGHGIRAATASDL